NGLPVGAVELTVDALGQAFLRGTVPTASDRDAMTQKVAAVPGISRVVNLLAVANEAPGAPSGPNDQPPPPPTPVPPVVPVPPVPDQSVPAPAVIDAADPVAERVSAAIRRRPALKDVRPQVTTRDGVVRLEGRVPTAYEAMLVFRAAQQTPGVRDVEDRLTFDLPQDEEPNPLATKARPEDAEPYLLHRIRRQVGELAHVDQVRLGGDRLEVVGTVTRDDDIPRVEATLRSIPLLRGLKLETRFLRD
ncbi:MAG: BON domain-containing protein, partial [Isosphaeraceae bacterium]